MIDQAELDRGEAKRARDAKHAKLSRSIAAMWRRERYQPGRDMAAAIHTGDREVFLAWMQMEGRYGGPARFGNWLAARDMSDVFHDGLRKQRMASIRERNDG